MANVLFDWLDRAPLVDDVDRRNARVIQLLLLFMAVSIPATFASAFIFWPQLKTQLGDLKPDQMVSIVMSQLIALCAVIGFVCVRRGALRLGVGLLLGSIQASMLVNAGMHGFMEQLPDQLAQMLVLILSALVLGRGALWITFGALLLALGVGASHDLLFRPDVEPRHALYDMPAVLFSYILVTMLLDLTTKALRESLRESNARGQRLQQEMIERERAQAQLIHAQKREIVERMAGGITHDFNNILSVIVSFAAGRHDDEAGSDAERAMQLESILASVEDTARRGMAISRRLLSFSRRDPENPECFDVGQAVNSLQPILRQMLGVNVTLRCKLPETTAAIRFERSQFELMLLNLASNSRDAIPEFGYFDIAVRIEEKWIVIEVSDDGHGMPEDVAARVFEPFYSTKPADSGTGLGLAVVHDLVVRAGGHIDIHSEIGVGTRFCIALPRTDAAASVVHAAVAQP